MGVVQLRLELECKAELFVWQRHVWQWLMWQTRLQTRRRRNDADTSSQITLVLSPNGHDDFEFQQNSQKGNPNNIKPNLQIGRSPLPLRILFAFSQDRDREHQITQINQLQCTRSSTTTVFEHCKIYTHTPPPPWRHLRTV